MTLTPYSDVIEAFKTPGKLRGKTPHTARRADLLPDQTVSSATRPD